MNKIIHNPPFVKKFDFRGIYGKDIKDEDAFYVGLALLKVLSPRKILIGWDTRVSSKNLALHFIEACKDKDIEICYLDKVPIDYVTVSAVSFDFDVSIMFTGSHNTWEWSGLLIHTKGGISLDGELVQQIVDSYNEVKHSPYDFQEADLASFTNFQSSVEKIYIEKLQSLIPLSEIKKMEVVVDLGDGSGSKSLTLVENLLPQVTFKRLHDRQLYDKDSAHIADPSEIGNMTEIIELIKSNGGYAAGFSFDSDADRVLAVDELGGYVNGSVLAGGIVECFHALGISSKRVGYAVECGPSLYNTIVDVNKTVSDPIAVHPIPVGRSLVRNLLFIEKIDVGVENVGHFYVKDFFMTDSAVFVMCIMLYWMSQNGKLSSLNIKHPDGFRAQTKVLNNVRTQTNEMIENNINSQFQSEDTKKINVDGIRYEVFKGEYMHSWYTIRQSGYEPIEKIYYGSLDSGTFDYLSGIFEEVNSK